MSEPVSRFVMEGDAEYGVFLERPHLRWHGEDNSPAPGWHSARSGDLLVACVAAQFAHDLTASRERVAAMRAHLLTRGHKPDCTWPHPSYGPDYGCSCGWLAALGEEAKDGER